MLKIYSLFEPKHPVKDKFHKTHFLEEIDKSENKLRQNGASREKFCEIEASAKWHAKNLRETPVDRGPSKVTNYFKEHDLLLVPFDKRNGFCVMGKSTYQTKLDQILDCPQFSRIDLSDDIIAKIENDINSTLLEMRKENLISENLSEVRSTGAQTARIYGRAKVRKKETPLRPVLSIPGIPEFLTPLFERVPGTNIDTSSLQAREKLENFELEDYEQTISLDVKKLYTNVPASVSIETALRSL